MFFVLYRQITGGCVSAYCAILKEDLVCDMNICSGNASLGPGMCIVGPRSRAVGQMHHCML
jgi:hypothetical protein